MTTDTPSTPVLTDAAQRSSGSFELVLGPVLMALVGLMIDSWLGTRPVFTLVLTVWGMVGAAVAIYYRYRQQIASTAVVRSAGESDVR